MDTTTVLEIIKMLENKLNTIGCTIGYIEENTFDSTEELKIQESTLILFKDHLQSFIENQLDAAELQSGE
jgi:hypothetical protein